MDLRKQTGENLSFMCKCQIFSNFCLEIVESLSKFFIFFQVVLADEVKPFCAHKAF